MREEICGGCHHFVPGGLTENGWCHRYPPVIIPRGDRENDTVEFPVVSATEFCGEWKETR